jgi:acyl-CoA synthetase (AMP-forming)/AMP-acid ligase II
MAAATGSAECLGELVRHRSAELGERVYVEDARSDTVLTFGVLEHWRTAFARSPLRAGTTVALSVSDPLLCAAAFVGAMASGLWVAPLDPTSPNTGPSGLASLAARVGADVVLSDRAAPAAAPSCPWVELASLAPGPIASFDPAEPVPVAASGGVILSSSGTTGPPKVVRLHQDKLLHTARCVVDHHQLTERDRGFNPLPLFHINAEVVGLLSTLLAGSCLVLDDRFHRTGFWPLMGARRVTWINAVPAIISRLAELRPDETVPAGIRFVRSASAPLPVATADRFETATGLPIVETYGMTEAASQIAAHPLSVPRRAGSVGLPVGLELRVVRDDAGAAGPAACLPGEVGEVEIRGGAVIEAYCGGEHADRFRPDGWLRTGDLGQRDADGYLYLVARTDDVINRGGEKVFPREIEEILSADPAVASVAVIAQEDPELGQVPVAFVALPGLGTGDVEEIARVVARLNETLARSLVPARRPVALHVVAAMPAGATGKVRRRALREPGLAVLHTFAGS